MAVGKIALKRVIFTLWSYVTFSQAFRRFWEAKYKSREEIVFGWQVCVYEYFIRYPADRYHRQTRHSRVSVGCIYIILNRSLKFFYNIAERRWGYRKNVFGIPAVLCFMFSVYCPGVDPGDKMISIRRLMARPSGVVFEASGRSGPYPKEITLSAGRVWLAIR